MGAQKDSSLEGHRRERSAHWDAVAGTHGVREGVGLSYRDRLKQIYSTLVAPGQRVLEIGCAEGDLLAALEPALGVGLDFSPAMLQIARGRHPGLHFLCADAHALPLRGTFDCVILSDVLNDLWDVQTVLEQIRPLTSPRTRIVVNMYSHLWAPILKLAERTGLATPNLPQNWLTVEDLKHLFRLTDFEVVTRRAEILWPLPTPLLQTFLNRYAVKLFPFSLLALSNVIVARPLRQSLPSEREPTVSVVVAARNEAGNIESLLERVPEMGGGTEVVFVEGHSGDDTYGTIERAIEKFPDRRCRLFRQPGEGKGDAVRMGFEMAKGDILMILDADLTVPPEDLPRFYQALLSGKGEFINGVRLVYPMEHQAMRFANLLGNKFFSVAFSWLLGQPLKDTLCGTKALRREDYARIAENRAYFGNFDPFGDFDLLFGAARQNLKITDLPVRYRSRTYGTTNIRRWTHGWLLLKMALFAARRLKFI
jgi:ubiquinone/menaquinone biosynthesis C-methylase UbiE